MCPGQCGNTFKISDEIMEKVVVSGDVVISPVCPNTDFNNENITDMERDGFATFQNLKYQVNAK